MLWNQLAMSLYPLTAQMQMLSKRMPDQPVLSKQPVLKSPDQQQEQACLSAQLPQLTHGTKTWLSLHLIWSALTTWQALLTGKPPRRTTPLTQARQPLSSCCQSSCKVHPLLGNLLLKQHSHLTL